MRLMQTQEQDRRVFLDSLQPLETIVHNFIWSEKHIEETEICDILIYTLS